MTGHVFPAPLSDKEAIWKAKQFVVAGFGLTEPLGKLPRADWNAHAATLVLSGLPSAQTLELVDSSTRGRTLGFGACYGDSGAPVFEETGGRLALIGIVTAVNGLERAA